MSKHFFVGCFPAFLFNLFFRALVNPKSLTVSTPCLVQIRRSMVQFLPDLAKFKPEDHDFKWDFSLDPKDLLDFFVCPKTRVALDHGLFQIVTFRSTLLNCQAKYKADLDW